MLPLNFLKVTYMIDHRDYMVQLAIDNKWKRGIELGVGTGMMYHKLLANTELTMIGVDLGLRPHRRGRVEEIHDSFPGRSIMHFMSTHSAAPLVPNGWADFVFIDAAHGYAAVKHDIELWQSKVKPGGWFGGHDYHPKFSGVIKAVNEAFGDKVLVLDHYIWTVTP